jgi:hypothetical protein
MDFKKWWARFLVGMPECGVLCLVTALSQRYECLCQLSLERLIIMCVFNNFYSVLVILCLILLMTACLVFIWFELIIINIICIS